MKKLIFLCAGLMIIAACTSDSVANKNDCLQFVEAVSAIPDTQSGFAVKMLYKAAGTPVELNVNGSSTRTQSPFVVLFQIKSDSRQTGFSEVTGYVQEKAGKYSYVERVMGEWVEKTFDRYVVPDPAILLMKYMPMCEKMKRLANEAVDGVEFSKFEVWVPGRVLGEMLVDTGLLTQVGIEYDGKDNLKLFDNVNDVPLYIWADKDSFQPKRFTLDLTAASAKVMQNLTASGRNPVDLMFTELNISARLERFGKDVGEIALPSDGAAVSAAEIKLPR